ncbi:MAG: NAD(P)-dependent oxidoreductase [Gordonia sp. (in: high G+C Gram-positive bacteria)]
MNHQRTGGVPETTGRRLVVVDSFIDLEEIAAAVAGLALRVERSSAIPTGDDVVALLVGPEFAMSAADLARLGGLRVLGATSAGYNHIPADAALAAGIGVVRAVDYCTEEVADHAFTMGCALLRSVGPLDRAVREGNWDVMRAPPRALGASTFGVLGYGRIGRAVAMRAAAVGMRVLATTRREITDGGIGRVEQSELLARADVVSVHIPLTNHSRGLVDHAFLAAMRPGAYLVNVSRGELVDEPALAEALSSGQLGGAALDVLTTEPPEPDNPLLTAPNTILTPHAAWYSPGVASTLGRQCGADVATALTGGVPVGAVTSAA